MKKVILLTVFSMLSQVGWATNRVPQKACIGPADGKVKMIYLHGWFMPGGRGDRKNYRQLEFNNRDYLENLARQLHIRIALPIGPQRHDEGWTQWDGTPRSQIEELAQDACGGAPLAPKLALVGFSNGAFKAHHIGEAKCGGRRGVDHLPQYVRIISIGAQVGWDDMCGGKVKDFSDHHFPPRNLAKYLEVLKDSSDDEPEETGGLAVTPGDDFDTKDDFYQPGAPSESSPPAPPPPKREKQRRHARRADDDGETGDDSLVYKPPAGATRSSQKDESRLGDDFPSEAGTTQ